MKAIGKAMQVDIIGWLDQNKTWVLSGIGVAIPIAVIGWLLSRGSPSHRQTQRSGTASSNLQAGGDINVSIGVSPQMPVPKQRGDRVVPVPINKPISQQPHFELKGLGFPRSLYVSQSHRDGIVEATTEDQDLNAVAALTLRFYNSPQVDGTSARALNVIAQLRFFSADWNKSADIDYGVWVDSPCDCTDMEVGDTRELILVLIDGAHYFALRDLRHDINRVYVEYVKVIPVDWFKNLRVTLIDQTSHASKEWVLKVWHDGQGWCHNVTQQPGKAPRTPEVDRC